MQETSKLKCPAHDLKFTLYCDNDTCKTMLCKTCYSQTDHDSHKIYGFGALREMPINATIEGKNAEFQTVAQKLKDAEKELIAQKALCQTYQEEIEKIHATEIGKTLFAQMGKNKEELIDACKDMMNTLNDYTDRTKRALESIGNSQKEMDLIHLINTNKSITESILQADISRISDPVISECQSILDSIAKDRLEEKLDLFKTQLGQPGVPIRPEKMAGKRKKAEPVVEPVPEITPTKGKKKAKDEKRAEEEKPKSSAKKGKKEAVPPSEPKPESM